MEQRRVRSKLGENVKRSSIYILALSVILKIWSKSVKAWLPNPNNEHGVFIISSIVQIKVLIIGTSLLFGMYNNNRENKVNRLKSNEKDALVTIKDKKHVACICVHMCANEKDEKK